jgi:hypothetical protein
VEDAILQRAVAFENQLRLLTCSRDTREAAIDPEGWVEKCRKDKRGIRKLAAGREILSWGGGSGGVWVALDGVDSSSVWRSPQWLWLESLNREKSFSTLSLPDLS